MSDDKNMKIGGDFKKRGEGKGVVMFVRVKKIEKAPAPESNTQPYCIENPIEFLVNKGFPPIDTIV